jgi:tetraacyldisaccharide 4'-kinase
LRLFCAICRAKKVWRVRLDEPSWWYAQAPGRLANVLQPLGALYGRAVAVRYGRARSYRSCLPVICIGNFTAGGTGKTPLAIDLCTRLKAAGHAPVALTRGYGGRLSGPCWVNATSDVAGDVGDEPLLLARAAPTLVARDRRLGVRAIEVGPHPATVVVMDDGLQNATLVKDLAIAVVDGSRGLGNGLVLPAGPLRAPLDFQLELTDAIVVNEGADAAGSVTQWLRRRFAGPVLRASVAPALATCWLKATRVVAWAGIGAPQRFFATLRALGADLAEAVVFRDHQRLGADDARRLLHLARHHGATLVTTEKDMVRLAGTGGALGELRHASQALPVRLALEARDAERLLSLVVAALQARR